MKRCVQIRFFSMIKCLIISVALFISFFSNVGAITSYAYDITSANFSHEAYGGMNPYTAGYKYQCSWYAWGRAYEKIGVKISSRLSQIVNGSVTGGYTTTPSTDSIAVYMRNDGYVTHVAYVEYFDGSTVWFSEGNSWRGVGVERYYKGSLSLSQFTGPTELKNAGATVLKFVPLRAGGSDVPPPASAVTITSSYATDITPTNAKVMASCYKPAGTNVATCGIYLGNTPWDMTKRNTETVSSAANAKDGGTHFDMWYNLTGELGIGLSPNTTYYCQFYCTVGGTEYKGDVFSFNTTGNSEISQKIHVHIPAGVTVQCYQNLGGTTKYRKIDPKSNPFFVTCYKYANYNGTNWFYFVDNQGNTMWFPDDGSYNVEYFPTSVTVEADNFEVGIGETKLLKFSVSPANYTGSVGLKDSGFTETSVEGNYLKITGTADSTYLPDYKNQVRIYTCDYPYASVIYSNEFDFKVSDVTGPEIDLESVVYSDETDEDFTVSFNVKDNYNFSGVSVKVWNDSEEYTEAEILTPTWKSQTSDFYSTYTFKVDKTTHVNWFKEGTFNMEILASDWKENLTKVIISHDVEKVNFQENAIIYVMDGGINHPQNPSSYTLADTNIILADPTKSGYNFNGWFYDSAFTNKVTSLNVTTGRMIILYAKWELIVPDNPSSGDGDNEEDASGGGNSPDDGKIPGGGNTSNSGTDNSGTPSPKGFIVKYHLNGGINNSDNIERYNGSQNVIIKSPSKKGYKFDGWYSNSQFNGSKISTISSSTTGTVSLYAKWTAIKYNVKFNANGGKGKAMKKLSMTYGKKKALIKNSYSRKGYKFKGWATSKANAKKGKVKYKNKASVKNLTTKNNGTVTLYAVWKKK